MFLRSCSRCPFGEREILFINPFQMRIKREMRVLFSCLITCSDSVCPASAMMVRTVSQQWPGLQWNRPQTLWNWTQDDAMLARRCQTNLWTGFCSQIKFLWCALVYKGKWLHHVRNLKTVKAYDNITYLWNGDWTVALFL